MSRSSWQGFALPILMVGLSQSIAAQEATSLLQPVADALRIGDVTSLRVVAAGSGYEERDEQVSGPPSSGAAAAAPLPPAATSSPESVRGADAQPAGGEAPSTAAATSESSIDVDPSSPLYVPAPPPPPRSYYRIANQVLDLDLAAESLRIERARAPAAGTAEPESPETTTIGPRADWTERHRYWLTPHGFVSGALEHDASVATETVDGVEYRTVSFTAEGGQQVRGYFDDTNQLVRVRTTLPAASGGQQEVVESFFEWRQQEGVAFPSMLIRKENGELAEVLVVKAVEARTPG